MALALDEIDQKLLFARRRLDQLLAMNDGDLTGANHHDRQQLIQEFFFHLVGSIEALAQLVNQTLGLNIDIEDVNINRVIARLPENSAVKSAAQGLYISTRQAPLPTDPYSDEGYLFRIYNYRNHITHRGRNPFVFRIGLGGATHREICLFLDPRIPTSEQNYAARPAQDELNYMYELIERRCREVTSILQNEQ